MFPMFSYWALSYCLFKIPVAIAEPEPSLSICKFHMSENITPAPLKKKKNKMINFLKLLDIASPFCNRKCEKMCWKG